jgi:hypothetical protein
MRTEHCAQIANLCIRAIMSKDLPLTSRVPRRELVGRHIVCRARTKYNVHSSLVSFIIPKQELCEVATGPCCKRELWFTKHHSSMNITFCHIMGDRS